MTFSRRYASSGILILALGVGGVAPVRAENAASVWSFVEERPLRSFDGKEYRRRDLEGRYVLLDFWATWCAPCLAELPTLKRITKAFGDERILLLGVSVNQTDRRTLASWLRRNAVTWPQLHDGRGLKGDMALRFGVETLPRTVLIDQRGRVVAVDLRGEELVDVLNALLPDE